MLVKNVAQQEYEVRRELIEQIFKRKFDQVFRKVKIHKRVRIKKAYLHNLPRGVQKKLFMLTDHLHDKSTNRIYRNAEPKSPLYKKLFVVYAVFNNKVVGWANYWNADKKRFINKEDSFVFIHVEKQYRSNGIGKVLFKAVYRYFLKGKRNHRKYFMPNIYKSEMFKSPDWYDLSLEKLRKGKI